MHVRSVIHFLTSCLVLTLSARASADPSAADPVYIEVFTAAAFPSDVGQRDTCNACAIRRYEVDGVAQIERRLSTGLSADPTAAKEATLKRIGALTTAETSRLKASAEGVALAAQLGIERVPAVVFNREAVVYGTSNPADALVRYRAWQREKTP